ncbi:MAG: hypothetical protein ACLTCQ_03205 [Enterocloster bolteae]
MQINTRRIILGTKERTRICRDGSKPAIVISGWGLRLYQDD